jgi:peptidoglycan hydrolase-like protein with peptidoglycan-binding domain
MTGSLTYNNDDPAGPTLAMGVTVAFGKVPLQRGDKGAAVVELQLRLAGFRGTLWDGKFGPGTELQVVCFQRDYMRRSNPTGQVDRATLDAILEFEAKFPIPVTGLGCPCGSCEGFGRGNFRAIFEAIEREQQLRGNLV